MFKALERHCGQVSALGPVADIVDIPGKLFNRFGRRFLRRGYDHTHSFVLAWYFGKVFGARLRDGKFDIAFAPAASTETALLDSSIPVIAASDATFPLANGYYEYYSRLFPFSVREATRVEARSCRRADALTFASAWAGESAARDYGVDPSRIFVVPYGANIDAAPPRETVLQRKLGDRCRLLFIGVEWERKGGPIAFRTLLKLEELGIRAQLTVIGCVPPQGFQHEHMRVIPFLDKNDPDQRCCFDQILMASDFFLLPTRAEAFGIVFCEASAFGLPSIATRTGGVPGVVRDGVNGYLLSPEEEAGAYARVVADLFSNPQRYSELVASSRGEYERRLNWDAWGKSMREIFDHVLSVRRARPSPVVR